MTTKGKQSKKQKMITKHNEFIWFHVINVSNLRIPCVSLSFPVFCFVFLWFSLFFLFFLFSPKVISPTSSSSTENMKNKKNNENQRKTKQKTGNDNETQGIHMFFKGATWKHVNSLCFVIISCFFCVVFLRFSCFFSFPCFP